MAESGDSTDGILAACPGLETWSTAGKSLAEIVAAVERWAPNVIYSHGLQDAILEKSLTDQFPNVLYAHNYYGTCVSGTKCHASPQNQTCQRTLGPRCLTAYLPRRCGGRNPLTMLRLYRRERRRQASLSQYRAVLVASHYMADEYFRHGVEETRIKYVPYFTPGKTDPLPPAPKPPTNRILFVGRLTALKGWRELIAAIPLASSELGRTFTLVVAGDGPDRTAFETETRRQGIPTEFLGWVNAEQRESEMRAADVIAVPSVWPEPFGLVGIEAGCVGLPAVGFAVGGIPDWLIPGVSGESAPGERPNSKELAAAIVRALSDEVHHQKLRVGAWETAQRFTPEAHLERLIPILEVAAKGP